MQKRREVSEVVAELSFKHYKHWLRREGVYKDMLDLLHYSDNNLLRYYRFPWPEILNIKRELEDHLAKPTRRFQAIPTYILVLVTTIFGECE